MSNCGCYSNCCPNGEMHMNRSACRVAELEARIRELEEQNLTEAYLRAREALEGGKP